jgi:flagellar basal-body rod modification protein FlgD
MEDTAFIAQMAQFTSLEQTKSLVSEFSLMRSSADFSSASALLGRQVTVSSAEDGIVTGAVDAVDASDGTPRLSVGGKLFPLSSLKRVEPAQIPAA